LNAPRTTGNGATLRLAEFASTLVFENIPGEVIDKARTCILDALGCCLFGSTLVAVRTLASMVAAEASGERAGVFGLSLRTSVSQAVLVNAASAHAFQLDEIHIESTLHPGSLAVPTVLALAEGEGNISGREIITAMVAAYEVGIRIGLAAKGGMFSRGFHNQGTTGVFVASTAAARLLRLDPGQTRHALGIGASQAAGLMAVQEGAMTKGFHCGRAAQSGVYAAKLAQLGYTGIPNVLEAPYGGFFSSFAENYSEDELTADLGERWETLKVGFKPAPAANGSITAMAAVDQIMRKHNLSAGDIEQVTALVSTNTLHHCGWIYDPGNVQGVLAAQMNLRYGIAVMALEREATVDQFREDKLRDPKILELINRVRVEVEPRYDSGGGKHRVACKAVVIGRNGARYEAEVLYRKGSHEDPMTNNELAEKFIGLATRAVPRESARQLSETISKLESLDNIDVLAQILANAVRNDRC